MKEALETAIIFFFLLLLGVAISWYIAHTINADMVHITGCVQACPPLNYNASNVINL